uniref:PiggyBac transposable element-derived protein domain-containing protein n=1 Tax=Trichuris muris TaxID=70415 RepID=A0A5S6Q5G5_TRIMR
MVLQQRKDQDGVRAMESTAKKSCQRRQELGYEQPVRNMLLFMHAWSEKLTTLNFCRVVLELPSRAAVKLNAAMRLITEEWVLKNPVPVGGPGLTVEVDESLFARRKYNRGQVLPQA